MDLIQTDYYNFQDIQKIQDAVRTEKETKKESIIKAKVTTIASSMKKAERLEMIKKLP